MDQTLIDTLNAAAQSHQYLLLAAALIAIIVPVVLHALGKDLPFVGPVLKALVEVVKGLKTVDPIPKDLSKPSGIAAVVPVEEPKPGDKGPQA